MGRRGPAPEPTVIKKLKGNPGRRPLNENEPMPETVSLSEGLQPPDFLSERGKEEFRRLARELEDLNLLTVLDVNALSSYCQHFDDFVEATLRIKKYGDVLKSPSGYVQQSPYVSMKNRASEMMHRLAQQFGMTPSSRSSLEVTTDAQKEKAIEEFLYGAPEPIQPSHS